MRPDYNFGVEGSNPAGANLFVSPIYRFYRRKMQKNALQTVFIQKHVKTHCKRVLKRFKAINKKIDFGRVRTLDPKTYSLDTYRLRQTALAFFSFDCQ